MRRHALLIVMAPLASACVSGGDDGETRSQALAQYNDGPNSCDGYGVSSFVAGVSDCRFPTGTVPITEATCPGAQWLWTGPPDGHSSSTGNEKGNAYCVQYPFTGEVDWGTYPGPRTAVVQEIAGLWVPQVLGCNKNVRVCLGTPENPASTAQYGVKVLNCGTGTGMAGPAGCAVCWSGPVRTGLVPNATDTCCTAGECLRRTLALTMHDPGHVVSDFSGIDCATGTCAADYSDLAHVTLTRDDEYVDWTGWGGACSGTADSCTVAMNEDRSVEATYELGGTVIGAISSDGLVAPLPRASNRIVARRGSTILVHLDGSGYTFAQSGLCTWFVASADAFMCGRNRTGAGSISVTHDASGATRQLEVEFVKAR